MVFEEFVCDVLGGMTDYSYTHFENLMNAFWNQDFEFIDNYKVSEYTNSIDAGGVNADVIDSTGFGNDYRLSESGDLNGSENSEALAEHGACGGNDSIWQQSNDSKEVYRRLEDDGTITSTGLGKRSGFVDWGRNLQSNSTDSTREEKRAYGILREISKRRIADVDAEGRKLTSCLHSAEK